MFFASAATLFLHRQRPYVVRRQKVLQALTWLQCHNPFDSDIEIDSACLATLPEHGVPDEFLFAGPSAPTLSCHIGPAQAQAFEDAALPLSAAVLDVEGENIMPSHFWREALPASCGSTSPPGGDYDVLVLSGSEPLSSFHVAFWVFCFPHLFPYGDGVDGGARLRRFPNSLWARHLLLRSDRDKDNFPWSLDLDFLATVFGVLHRREVMRAVQVKINAKGFSCQIDALKSLQATDFAALARVMSANSGIKEALRVLDAPSSLMLCYR